MSSLIPENIIIILRIIRILNRHILNWMVPLYLIWWEEKRNIDIILHYLFTLHKSQRYGLYDCPDLPMKCSMSHFWVHHPLQTISYWMWKATLLELPIEISSICNWYVLNLHVVLPDSVIITTWLEMGVLVNVDSVTVKWLKKKQNEVVCRKQHNIVHKNHSS